MDIIGKTSGTLVNVITVILGCGLGVLIQGRINERTNRTLLQVLGLVTLTIGIGMSGDLGKVNAGPVPGVILALVSLALGGVVGEAIQLEDRLEQLGDWLKARFRGGGSFTQGFVTASLLFCVGPLTLIGSIQNGLQGNAEALMIKAALDGIAAIALTSVYGVGVAVSALVVLVLQGGISLAAGSLAAVIPDPATDPRVLLTTGAGGMMILGISVNLLLAGLEFDGKRVRVGSLLPTLVIAPFVYALARAITG